GEPYSII
ncbi:acetyl-CoA synthase domain protein, partial [Vibrio parahaemolyticus V-223/04]